MNWWSLGRSGAWMETKSFTAWVTCVPSLNPAHRDLIPDYRLATLLGLPFVQAVCKVRTTSPQKEMQNSWQQAHMRLSDIDAYLGISESSGAAKLAAIRKMLLPRIRRRNRSSPATSGLGAPPETNRVS
jgi:hypothetical protein